MKIAQKLYFLIFIFCFMQAELVFDKVVIWGYKLHSHTHSYIHDGFYKAFLHLGYPTYWFDDTDNTFGFDFSNTLFLTMGDDANLKMPLLPDCYYLLHNANNQKFKDWYDRGHALAFQVYTHRSKTQHPDVQKVDECIYFSKSAKVVYMPWATDLLPEQIDEMKARVSKSWNRKKDKIVTWVGTIWDGTHGNREQINRFKSACEKKGFSFKHLTTVSPEQNKNAIFNSYWAPALVGQWQATEGYIPCRIFKNISYGQWGVTNSKAVYDLFDKKIIYNPDTKDLFSDAQRRRESLKLDELLELMDMVKNKHTYIKRIELLLSVLNSAVVSL